MLNVVRIDNINPLISYAPAGDWSEGTPASDPEAGRYLDGTFAVTFNKGATATLTFYGSHVTLYGAKRDNHDLYSVQLDGNATVTFNGNSATGLFQTALYDSGDLREGAHTVVLADASTNAVLTESFLDLDFIDITTTVGDQNILVDDSAGYFDYAPAGDAWNTSPQNVTGFSGGTGHATNGIGATATLAFVGDGVDVYGLVGGASGPYNVAVDGGAPAAYSAANAVWLRPQQLLYSARGLGNGSHVVTLTNIPLAGSSLSIDYAQIFGAAPSAIYPSGHAPAAPTGGSSPAAAAALGVVTALLIIALGACAYLFFLLRRRPRALDLDLDLCAEPDVGVQPFLLSTSQAPSAASTSGYPVSVSVSVSTATVEAPHLALPAKGAGAGARVSRAPSVGDSPGSALPPAYAVVRP